MVRLTLSDPAVKQIVAASSRHEQCFDHVPQLQGANNWSQWQDALKQAALVAGMDAVLNGDSRHPNSLEGQPCSASKWNDHIQRIAIWRNRNEILLKVMRKTLSSNIQIDKIEYGSSNANRLFQGLEEKYRQSDNQLAMTFHSKIFSCRWDRQSGSVNELSEYLQGSFRQYNKFMEDNALQQLHESVLKMQFMNALGADFEDWRRRLSRTRDVIGFDGSSGFPFKEIVRLADAEYSKIASAGVQANNKRNISQIDDVEVNASSGRNRTNTSTLSSQTSSVEDSQNSSHAKSQLTKRIPGLFLAEPHDQTDQDHGRAHESIRSYGAIPDYSDQAPGDRNERRCQNSLGHNSTYLSAGLETTPGALGHDIKCAESVVQRFSQHIAALCRPQSDQPVPIGELSGHWDMWPLCADSKLVTRRSLVFHPNEDHTEPNPKRCAPGHCRSNLMQESGQLHLGVGEETILTSIPQFDVPEQASCDLTSILLVSKMATYFAKASFVFLGGGKLIVTLSTFFVNDWQIPPTKVSFMCQLRQSEAELAVVQDHKATRNDEEAILKEREPGRSTNEMSEECERDTSVEARRARAEQSLPQSRPEDGSESQPEARSESQSEAGSDSQSQAESESQSETQSESESESQSGESLSSEPDVEQKWVAWANSQTAIVDDSAKVSSEILLNQPKQPLARGPLVGRWRLYTPHYCPGVNGHHYIHIWNTGTVSNPSEHFRGQIVTGQPEELLAFNIRAFTIKRLLAGYLQPIRLVNHVKHISGSGKIKFWGDGKMRIILATRCLKEYAGSEKKLTFACIWDDPNDPNSSLPWTKLQEQASGNSDNAENDDESGDESGDDSDDESGDGSEDESSDDSESGRRSESGYRGDDSHSKNASANNEGETSGSDEGDLPGSDERASSESDEGETSVSDEGDTSGSDREDTSGSDKADESGEDEQDDEQDEKQERDTSDIQETSQSCLENKCEPNPKCIDNTASHAASGRDRHPEDIPVPSIEDPIDQEWRSKVRNAKAEVKDQIATLSKDKPTPVGPLTGNWNLYSSKFKAKPKGISRIKFYSNHVHRTDDYNWQCAPGHCNPDIIADQYCGEMYLIEGNNKTGMVAHIDQFHVPEKASTSSVRMTFWIRDRMSNLEGSARFYGNGRMRLKIPTHLIDNWTGEPTITFVGIRAG